MSENLRKALELVDEALSGLDNHPEPYSSDWLYRRSLLSERDEVKAHIVQEIASEQQQTLRFLLEGPAVASERLDARFLGTAMLKLQETLAAVGQAVAGRPTPKGSVPSDIEQRTNLRFAAAAYGSFGILLVGEPEALQAELFPDAEPPGPGLLEESVLRLFDVLEATAAPDADETTLLDSYADLGERAVGRLKELSDALMEQPARLRLVWNGQDVPERELELSRPEITALNSFLGGVDTKTTPIRVEGRLAGARTDTDVFFFREAGTERLFQGAVAEEVVPKLRQFFAENCVADLEETVARTRAGGREVRRYVLTDLEPI